MSCVEYHNSQNVFFSPTKILQCITLFGSDHIGYNVTLSKGTYKIELWGASGGAAIFGQINKGGLGGYSSGLLTLYNRETFIFEVGTKGSDSYWESTIYLPGIGGYNGGANGGYDTDNNDCPAGGSGGSTDMRTNSSISSRIIVAGGGGSGGCYLSGGNGGNGGGISGTKGADNTAGKAYGGSSGTQNNGHAYLYGEQGSDGGEAGGSGGGGYWGGKSGGATNDGTGGAGGGGGSSFISGHPQCIVIEPYIFKNAITITGDNLMPSNSCLNEYVVGNEGNGSVRIISISILISCLYQKYHMNKIILIIIIISKS